MRQLVMAGQYLDVLVQARGDFSADGRAAGGQVTRPASTPSRGRCSSAPRSPVRRRTSSRRISAYGLPLGEAFQLRDDVLGVFGDPVRTGKPSGDDLREGKQHAARRARHGGGRRRAGGAACAPGLGDRSLDDDGVAAEICDVIVATGALEQVEARIAGADRRRRAPRSRPSSINADAREVLDQLAVAATERHT